MELNLNLIKSTTLDTGSIKVDKDAFIRDMEAFKIFTDLTEDVMVIGESYFKKIIGRNVKLTDLGRFIKIELWKN